MTKKMIKLQDHEGVILLKGIVICKESGEYLLDLIMDSEINPVLLSSFIGALSLFGKNNLGKIEEIIIKGLDVDMIIVAKHELILIAILDQHFGGDNIRKEAEKALDNFYLLYEDDIKKKVIDVNEFKSFKNYLKLQIDDYFQSFEPDDQNQDVGDFGFFTDAILKMRSKN